MESLANGTAVAMSLAGASRMDPLLISAASGMKARMESLDMLANNIANTGRSASKRTENSTVSMNSSCQ